MPNGVFVSETLSSLMGMMKLDGEIAKVPKTRRSLGKHILKDHAALAAYFQSQQWDNMQTVMGKNVVLYTYDAAKNKDYWQGSIADFWQARHEEKQDACHDWHTIELEIYSTDIELKDEEIPMLTLDCKSIEHFEFHVVCLDDKGEIINNQSGGGSSGRDHSGTCPWV